MLKVVVLVSGGGTNLQAILDAIKTGDVQDVEITAVISNNQNAYALKRAKEHGIVGKCISPRDYVSRRDFEVELLHAIQEEKPDLIVLAGFLVMIPESMIQVYPNQIINIHPSLIPAFSGEGYYGLHVHEEALKRGVKIAGATVHFVDEGIDTGAIILQKAVNVLEDDTPESLQLRVMKEAEWEILPKAIQYIAEKRVCVKDGRVTITNER